MKGIITRIESVCLRDSVTDEIIMTFPAESCACLIGKEVVVKNDEIAKKRGTINDDREE